MHYMSRISNSQVENQRLHDQMQTLLRTIGYGHMMNTAYDTAWAARLHHIDKPFAMEALKWLRRNQLDDGSWGAAFPVYHHDRVICTLAAMIALDEWGFPEDEYRLQKAVSALHYHLMKLHLDPTGETIAFEMLLPALLSTAKARGLIDFNKTAFLITLSDVRQQKLERSPGGMISRAVTMAFSAEMAGSDGQHLLDIDNIQEPDGSIAYSPSATAYYLQYFADQNKEALTYLHNNMKDGGLPNVAPFDIFEQSWTLWNVHLSDIDNDDLLQDCQRHLDFLEDSWEPQRGVGFSAKYLSKDSDSSGIAYEVLTRSGRIVDLDTFQQFEGPDYYYCLPLEANASVSANIHVLGALTSADLGLNHPSILKILRFLRRQQNAYGYWVDKWHASPYYTTAHAIIALSQYDENAVQNAIHWILKTQNIDGSWGYYAQPTVEETAYCLQALATGRKYGLPIPDETLLYGRDWLVQHQYDPYPPLWIGKCLYTPCNVIWATVLSAQTMVGQIVKI